MPVEHSPVRQNTSVASSTRAHLNQFAFNESNTNSPKRPKRKNDEISEPDEPDLPNEQNATEVLNYIYRTVRVLSKNVSDIKQQLNTHIQNCPSDNITALNATVQNLQTQLEAVVSAHKSTNNSNKITKEQYENNKKLRKDITDWESQHFKRRDAFYACYRAEREKAHLEDFVNGDAPTYDPYIPKKFRPKPIVGETEARYKIREKRSIANMMSEIELRTDTITCKKEEYTSIDTDIQSKIDLVPSEDKKRELKELWKTETESAEIRGKEYWNEKKEPWWINLKEKEPYMGYQTEMEVEETEEQDENQDADQNNERDQTVTNSRNTRPTYNHQNEQNFSWRNSNRTNHERSTRTPRTRHRFNSNARNDSITRTIDNTGNESNTRSFNTNTRNSNRSRRYPTNTNNRSDSRTRTTGPREHSFLDRGTRWHQPR